jgi:hypothetical protein
VAKADTAKSQRPPRGITKTAAGNDGKELAMEMLGYLIVVVLVILLGVTIYGRVKQCRATCFFVPIIDAAIRARAAGEAAHTRAIVIYPMNALANCQIKELEKFIEQSGLPQPLLPTFAHFTGQESFHRVHGGLRGLIITGLTTAIPASRSRLFPKPLTWLPLSRLLPTEPDCCCPHSST